MDLFTNSIIWVAYMVALYFSVFLILVYLDKEKIFKTEKSSLALPQEPIVSILVPAYNEEKTILKTLNSINNLIYPKEKLEVIVIDDGSKDNTKQIVKDYIKDKPHFRLISHQNKGKAASMNRALGLAKGEFFACLDADSFVEPETLRKMLYLYYKENNPQVVIITPAMKVYQPRNVLQKIQWLEYLVIILIARISSQLDSLYVAPGPFSLYRTKIIQQLGGFDEENITEDQEIAYHVQQQQYKIKQCFDGYVYTTAPDKLKPFYQQRKRWYLGSIMCLHKYKNMIANRKYGDFGLMQMVKNVLGYFLAFTGILAAVYIIFIPLVRHIKNSYLVKFNFLPYLLNFEFKFDLLNFLLTDFKKSFIVVFLFAIGLFFFWKAHRNANEKIRQFGWVHLVPYFLFYYMLKGTILLVSLFEFTKKKKMKW